MKPQGQALGKGDEQGLDSGTALKTCMSQFELLMKDLERKQAEAFKTIKADLSLEIAQRMQSRVENNDGEKEHREKG